jgi:O-antigen/teichoic acid export membrane protein
MSRAMHQRVIAAMGAHSMGMAISVGIQLASLPLFLATWDAATYGMWLLLSALPAYLTMADVGMVTAAGNRMTMAQGAGDTAMANRVFQSAQVFMLFVCAVLAALALPAIWWSPWPADATLDQRMALMALTASVLVAFAGGLSEQLFKATHRYALGTLLGNLTRLAEWAGWMLGLLLVGSFSAVAFTGLVFRAAGTLLTMVLARTGEPGMQWGLRQATTGTVRDMVRPAAAFMAFPLANALSFQGVTLLVGALLGPVAVAIFSTYRTLARIAVQVTAMFSHSLWPEFSRLFGQGSLAELRQLAGRSGVLSAAQVLLLCAALYAVAPWLLSAWTHDKIAFDPTVVGLLIAYAAVSGLWHVPRVLLMSTNQHGVLALWALLGGVVCVMLTAWWAPRAGLTGVGLAMLSSELLVAAACIALALRVLGHREPARTVMS